jgi:hypothetical protein
VFALNCATHTGSIPFQIGRRAQEALDRHATRRAGAGEIEFAATRRRVPAFQWADEADNAARLLPFATERFWVESEGQKILMLCFHPTPGEIAVYNPATGTTQARCASTDGAEIVAAVAARIGYRVDAVQRETAADPAILMASAESMPGEISR